MTQTAQLTITLLTGLAVNAALLPLVIFLAHRNRWYDERNHRKIHTDDMPRLGGVGIFIGFLVTTVIAFVLASENGPLPSMLGIDASVTQLAVYFAPMIGGMAIVFVLGLVDDFRDLRATLKLVLQIVAAAVVCIGPFRIDSITVPFVWYRVDLGLFSYPITVLWVVAVTNAINFIDGVDGLAGGASAIAALSFAIVAVLLGQTTVALVVIGLFGCLVGFLIYNMPRARIFMGDSGSYVIGFALAMVPLLLSDDSAVSLDLIPAITILLLPIADMTTAVLRRIRRGKHPFTADRLHIHHKLMDLGFSTGKLIAAVYVTGVLLGGVGIAWYLLPVNYNMGLVLLSWLVGTVLVARITYLRRRLGPTT